MKRNGKKGVLGKLLVGILVGVLVMGCFSSIAQAKTKTVVFKDVTTKTEYQASIKYLYDNGAYVGIAEKGKKFKPNAIMTRREFVKTLRNLYGSRISIKTPKKNVKLTQSYATETLCSVSKQLGYKVRWSGGAPKATVTRAKAAYYVRLMIKNGGGKLNPN